VTDLSSGGGEGGSRVAMVPPLFFKLFLYQYYTMNLYVVLIGSPIWSPYHCESIGLLSFMKKNFLISKKKGL